MNRNVLLVAFLPAFALAASTSLQFVPLPNGQATAVFANGVLPMAAGSVAVYGAQTLSPCNPAPTSLESCDQIQPPLLSILDVTGKQTATLGASALGSGNSSIVSAALDSSGNIWITGETDSDDFPLVHALFTAKTAYRLTGFVAKVDPNLNILFSTYLGGQAVPTQAQSTPASITLDSAGNSYIVGSTNDSAFPVTGTFFGPTLSGNPPVGTYAFISSIAADGSKLRYSRLLGGTSIPCSGSTCIGTGPYTAASAVALDASGNITVAGTTSASNFPITANVYNTSGGAFVSRISADGSMLIWSTEVGAAILEVPDNTSAVQAIALDSAGNVYVVGSSDTPIATTPNALQSTYQTAQSAIAEGFAMKLSADATQLLFATNLGGMNGATLAGLAVDAAGNVWVTGFTRSPDFPGLNGVANIDFALELNSGATALQQIFPLVSQTLSQPPTFDSNGNLLLLASAGNLLRLNPATAYSIPAVFALTNAAIPRALANVGPGDLMTLYGVGLGPNAPIIAAPDATGAWPTQLGGFSIQFSGPTGTVSAPLLYAAAGQVNFEVPPNLYQPSTVTVVTATGSLPLMTLNIAGSIGIFAVVNADGSINSASHPAKDGSAVSLYLTGLGLASYGATDGNVSPSANAAFTNLVEVDWSGGRTPLPLFYAGTAPVEIDGLDQINVQLPTGILNPILTVAVSTVFNTTLPGTSNAVTIYAQ